MERYSDYDALAWIYNKYWVQPQQLLWSPLESLVLKDVPAAGHILDLCCGTGQLAADLVGRGFRVTGVDGSSEMLRFARENAPEAEFVLSDARSLDFPPTFDGAVSQFGSLNHVMNLQELRSVFEQVHRSLLSHGRFLFDLNTEEGFLARWSGSVFGHAEDDHAFIAGGTYDPDHKIGRFSVTMFFLRDEGWHRSDVALTERAYSEAEVCQALEAAGFQTARTFDAREDLGVDEAGRAFFLAEKS
jgi:SAM-dependent methyltransferase